MTAAFHAHLAQGTTTVARCYSVTRGDGTVMGFTDHDRDIEFAGMTFRAETGLTARALQQATGLSVDNSEAFGGLSSDAISEADILAGRFDGSDVQAWLVNWKNPVARILQFRGTLGEVTRSGGAFTAELRGLSEALNQPLGNVYHARCGAVLGDKRCRVNLSGPGYFDERATEVVEDSRFFGFADFPGFDDRWFEKGRLEVLSGAAAGLVGLVKNDRVSGTGTRVIELWQSIGAVVAKGDMLRIVAGCDRRADTCRLKFNNFLNFRGFPLIPGEDWLMAYPVSSGINDGSSLSGGVGATGEGGAG